MNLLLLALRNLLRNRRRSLATLLAMAIGSSAILLFGGYAANIRYSMLTAYVRGSGHLQVQHRDYYTYGSGNPVAYSLADHARILEAINGDAELQALLTVATPTLQFGALAGNFDAGVSRTVIGNGYVAADVNRMRAWNEFGLPNVAPPFALDGAAPDAAIVGTGVARVLQLCGPLNVADCPRPADTARPAPAAKDLPADIAGLSALESPASAPGGPGAGGSARGPKIELLVSSSSGAPNVASLQVLRAESQGFKELDEVYVVLHLQQAQRVIFGRTPPRVTAIMLQLKRTASLPAARQRLETVLAGLKLAQPVVARDFEQLNPFYVQSMQLFDTIFGFIFILIGGIVLFTVGNTMNTVVVERTVEIGTLRAIGLRQRGIRMLFIVEGLLLGLSGAVVGVLAALGLAFAVNHSGLTWLPPGSAEILPLNLHVWGEWRMMVGSAVGLVLIATASAWWPAYRAARVKIVDALRHV